ncbi:hypothetical protein [Streptomyces osmaniensis]|uniref:Holin n=1 Tax=Streptomyces osmaniensis TaxID=593134 RepID=A0ABP6Z2H6_9ACTN|nr:hypothetical protein KJK32_44385 [Streptomyces sp. JCM17656]
MTIEEVGALCFGIVIGWITYRTLIRKASGAAVSDIASVIGAVGGAAVTGLFANPRVFAWYCIGLAAGFLMYFILYWILAGHKQLSDVMGGQESTDPGRDD